MEQQILKCCCGQYTSDAVNLLYDKFMVSMNYNIPADVLTEENTKPVSKVIGEAKIAIVQLEVLYCAGHLPGLDMNKVFIPAIACVNGCAMVYLVKREYDYLEMDPN